MNPLSTSCLISSTIPFPCLNGTPGVYTMYVTNFSNLSSYTLNATNVVTGMTMSTGTTYQQIGVMKGSAEFHQNGTQNVTQGTFAVEQLLDIFLAHYQTSIRNQIMIWAAADMTVIIQDRNGIYWLMGAGFGVNLSTSASTTGKDWLADPNGYQITLRAQEPVEAYEVSASLIAGVTTSIAAY